LYSPHHGSRGRRRGGAREVVNDSVRSGRGDGGGGRRRRGGRSGRGLGNHHRRLGLEPSRWRGCRSSRRNLAGPAARPREVGVTLHERRRALRRLLRSERLLRVLRGSDSRRRHEVVDAAPATPVGKSTLATARSLFRCCCWRHVWFFFLSFFFFLQIVRNVWWWIWCRREGWGQRRPIFTTCAFFGVLRRSLRGARRVSREVWVCAASKPFFALDFFKLTPPPKKRSMSS
jgi:hypothetical protein